VKSVLDKKKEGYGGRGFAEKKGFTPKMKE